MNDSRTKGGLCASAVGIGCNFALAAGKIAIGLAAGLVSVSADGFNNFSDCAAGVVAFLSFCLSRRPPDARHPFGHRRMESIAAMLTGVLVLFLGVELLRASIARIAHPEPAAPTPLVFVLLGVSLAVKAGLFFFDRAAARRLSSDVLRAAAADSLCDCAVTAAVALGLLAAVGAGAASAEGWISLGVVLFILYQGVRILGDAGSKLLGTAPDAALVERLLALLRSDAQVLGVHDLRVFCYGGDADFATAHVELDAATSALATHALLDTLEERAHDELGVVLTLHLDPVDLADGEARALETRVRSALGDDVLAVHDFRLIRGAVTRVRFDAVVPYAEKRSDPALRADFEARVRALDAALRPVVTIERAAK